MGSNYNFDSELTWEVLNDFEYDAIVYTCFQETKLWRVLLLPGDGSMSAEKYFFV